VYNIPISNLMISFLPALAVVGIMWYWSIGVKTSLVALARMLLQLLLIGYVLTYIFAGESSLIVLAVLIVMMVAASWISLGVLDVNGRASRRELFPIAFLCISLIGSLVLALVTQVVLNPNPWHDPKIMIPLAGMVYSAAMTAISLAAERYFASLNDGYSIEKARASAFNATMIPAINSLLAVGLVSLPGMMTGQILSGISPLIAVRYQIVIMCMIFSVTGLAAASFLYLLERLKR